MSERTWTIEMMWDCSHCGTRNPGMTGEERESLKCTNCGAEKTDESWVMPDSPLTAPALTGELDRKARAGANWTCRFCNGESRADRTECEVCGAARDEEPPKQVVPEASPVPAKPARPVSPVRPTTPVRPVKVASSTKEPTPYRSLYEPDEELRSGVDSETVFKFVVGVGAAILAIWLMVWAFTPNSTVVAVNTMTWSRERVLLERHSYTGEGWRSSAPSGVYSWDHCETRQRGTESCNPHSCNCRNESYQCNCTGGVSYECRCTTRNNCSRSCTSNRNGSATCSERCSPSRSCSTCRTPRQCSTCSRRVCSTCYDQCPVYAQWCQYRYYRWDRVSQARTAGNEHGAVWPNLNAQGPLQRIESTESYTIRFTDTRSDRAWVRDYSFDAYERFNLGQRWNIEWTRAGGFDLKGLAR